MEKSFVFKFMGLNFDLTGIIGSTLMALAVFLICLWLARKVEMKPNKRQNVFEYLLDFTNGIVKDNVSDVDAQKHLSLYALVLFLFIWFMNQLGMFMEVKVDDWVFIKSPTADPVATMSFAMMTLLLSFTFGVQRFGVGGYLKNYTQPVGFMLPINLIEEFTNFLTLSLRLYGNIYAGEVLLTLIGNDLAHAGGPFTLILAAPLAMI
ncbi:MAG: F0F1 ATP synthase subunit A, partial [Lactobacillus sp.]|nr:F0F1 ATP synthase subunit A [Lactobacillus sp.]